MYLCLNGWHPNHAENGVCCLKYIPLDPRISVLDAEYKTKTHEYEPANISQITSAPVVVIIFWPYVGSGTTKLGKFRHPVGTNLGTSAAPLGPRGSLSGGDLAHLSPIRF